VLGSEAMAKGIDVVQGPDINIDRVPQDGRTFETLGEDPNLTGQLGVAVEHGMESQGAGAMPKHFAVYNQETYRNTPADDVIMSDRALHEIYLPAWQQSVAEGHPSSIMCSYASLAGNYSCQSSYLLTTILRDQFGFSGFIRSDLDGVHDPVAGFNAGTDQLKPAKPQELEQAVFDGQVSMARVNQAVGSVLTQMFRLGVFNRQTAGNASTDASAPAHIGVCPDGGRGEHGAAAKHRSATAAAVQHRPLDRGDRCRCRLRCADRIASAEFRPRQLGRGGHALSGDPAGRSAGDHGQLQRREQP
jgi:beta-glucosidase